jgi:predicted nucleotidyltransferase
MVTQQTAITMVREFAQEVKALGINLNRVILFGSVAANRQHEYSDIDVALVADDFSGVGFIDIKRFVKALRKHYIIQPRTFATKDFNKGDAFTEEIKNTGIEINI